MSNPSSAVSTSPSSPSSSGSGSPSTVLSVVSSKYKDSTHNQTVQGLGKMEQSSTFLKGATQNNIHHINTPSLTLVMGSPSTSPQSLPSGYFSPPAIEDTPPPIGPDHEAVSTELDERLSKAIGKFSGGAFTRLDPNQ